MLRLSAPRQVTWWIALIAGSLGVLQHYHVVHLPVIGAYATFLIVGAWALLLVGTLLRGL